MRVAILDARPGAGGVTVFSFQLRDGFRSLGHQADYVTFTKSGRTPATLSPTWWQERPLNASSSFSWWHQLPDVVAKFADARQVLSDYDLVLLAEPAFRINRKNPDVSWLEVLASSPVPWSTFFHGVYYNSRGTPFLEETLSLPTFSGTGFFLKHQVHASNPDVFDRLVPNQVLVTHLPYALQNTHTLPSSAKIIGMTGRFGPQKGHPMVGRHAATLVPANWSLQLYGACQSGRGPNETFLLYEHLLNQGWRGERDASASPSVAVPWRVEDTPGNRAVEYKGAYTPMVNTRFPIYIHASYGAITRGHVEYAMLEALDCGNVVVAPSHVQDGIDPGKRFRVVEYAEFERAQRPGKEDPHVIRSLQEAIRTAVDLVADRATRNEMILHNRTKIVALHDPAIFVRRILEELS